MINTDAIRNKVLNLALRGSITEQLQGEGTAEELYRQIQQERMRQETIGTIKRVDICPEITADSVPFIIPDNWKWTSLGNVSYIVRGGSPRPIKDYLTTKAEGINWIKIGDVEKGGKYVYSTHEKIIPEGESKSRRVYPGDFLLTNSMSFGRPYISQVEGCIHDGWLLIHGLGGFNPDFLYYLLSSPFLYSQFNQKASGSTVDNLNIDKVKAAIIPLPPLAEQKRIAEQVEKVFAILDRIDAVQAEYSDNLEALKEKVIEAAMHGQLTEQLSSDSSIIEHLKRYSVSTTHNENYNDIPDSWCCAQLSKICDLDTGNSIPEAVKKEKYQGYNGGYPYIGTKDVGFDHIVDYENGVRIPFNEPKFIIAENTSVLLCIEGGSAGRKIAIINQDVCYGNKLCKFYTTIINPRYIYYFLQSYSFKKLFKNKVTGLIGGVSISTLRKLTIPVPPIEEQQRIVERLDSMLSIFDSMTAR